MAWWRGPPRRSAALATPPRPSAHCRAPTVWRTLRSACGLAPSAAVGHHRATRAALCCHSLRRAGPVVSGRQALDTSRQRVAHASTAERGFGRQRIRRTRRCRSPRADQFAIQRARARRFAGDSSDLSYHNSRDPCAPSCVSCLRRSRHGGIRCHTRADSEATNLSAVYDHVADDLRAAGDSAVVSTSLSTSSRLTARWSAGITIRRRLSMCRTRPETLASLLQCRRPFAGDWRYAGGLKC